MCSAAFVGACLALLFLLFSCAHLGQPPGAAVHRLPAPDPPGETSCAWFGDVRGGVLYFGVSAFWSALRAAGGDPAADLRAPGPRWIGRFELASESFLPPLAVGPEGSPSGVWDVLAHPNGRVYFTTWFDAAGSVDPRTGEVAAFEAAGPGLNELALGPGGTVLATRYGDGASGEGSLVVLAEDGAVLAEHPLEAPPGRHAAAKSVAFDPLAREVWVNTDLFGGPEPGAAHDARVLALDGVQQLLVTDPELQFFVFAADGTGYLAEASEGRLRLRVRRPPGRAPRDEYLPLDDTFDAAHDFVQEVRVEPGGHVVVTRWSGRVHVLGPDGQLSAVQLPRTGAGELYYTGTLAGSRVCATRCGAVDVVCADLPAD